MFLVITRIFVTILSWLAWRSFFWRILLLKHWDQLQNWWSMEISMIRHTSSKYLMGWYLGGIINWSICLIGISFRFFMEKQIMGEFARILRISKLSRVSLQLLQTMSIMIQNLRNEHSICKSLQTMNIHSIMRYLSCVYTILFLKVLICKQLCFLQTIFSAMSTSTSW